MAILVIALILETLALGACIAWAVSVQRRVAGATRDSESWSNRLRQLTLTLHKLVGETQKHEEWPRMLCEQVAPLLESGGAVIFQHADGEEGRHAIQILGYAGVWPEPLASPEAVLPLSHNIPNDFYWSRRPLVYSGISIRGWLPDMLSKHVGSALVGPITLSPAADYFLMVYREPDSEPFGQSEQNLMAECIGQMEITLHAIFAIGERKRLEEALNRAHEEGMLQISTGIIHNIGNVITVIQLALERLRDGDLGNCGEMIALMEKEMLPTLSAHQAAGDLEAFLRDDPQGRAYLESLAAVVEQLRKVLEQHDKEIAFVVEKFRTVTEIISLQQQFIGELGTENVVSIRSVVEDVGKLCSSALEQRGIVFQSDAVSNGRILVDPGMLRHILLLLMKYSIESVTASRKVNGRIMLSVVDEKDEEGREWIRLSLSDNGAGINVNMAALDALHGEHPADERIRDLIFCRRRIEKYGGTMGLVSDFARGLKLSVNLPRYADDWQKTDSTPTDGMTKPSAPGAKGEAAGDATPTTPTTRTARSASGPPSGPRPPSAPAASSDTLSSGDAEAPTPTSSSPSSPTPDA